MVSWIDHAIWWQLYPLGFVGAPTRPTTDERTDGIAHRLARIEGWLDHLLSLGLNGLALGPVFESSTHGYDTVDHFRIDSRLGDDTDFDHLVYAAHERGIRVLLDGVFNHVGRAHPAFEALEQHGAAADTADMFRVRWDGWQPGDPVQADVFEGHEQLVALNHASPAVEDLVAEVMTHWLDRGADGWRLDAAYAVPPAFWSRVLPRVRSTHPDAWITGEVIQGDLADVVRGSTMDSVTQYELWQGIWHSIADVNFFELKHAIERSNALLRTFVPSTFIGNHDVTRIASAVGDLRHLPHAVVPLFTLAGTPSVYAGDEYAYRGVKEARIGGDDAVRPEFAEHPPSPDSLEDEARAAMRLHQELIALRRRFPWLHDAHSDVVHVSNTSIVIRTATGSGAVVAALHLGDAPADLPAGGASAVVAGAGTVAHGRITVPPHGWAVLTG
ncbi:MAG TPA: alpha-amylase family glycosyl hydrolase [Nocardioidaceae bacterium]|nr:alpha-amylase family glycosyl hydrolase [Nocardioidaceae bacterium]